MGPWGHQWGYGAAMGPSVGPWGHQWGYGAAMGPLWCHVCPPQVSRQLLSLWAAAGRGDAVAVGQAVAALCRRAPTLQAAVAASRRGGGGDGGPSAARGLCGVPGRCRGAVGKLRQGRRGRRSGGRGGVTGTQRPAGGYRRRTRTALRRGRRCTPARTAPHPPAPSAGSGSGGAGGRRAAGGAPCGGGRERRCPPVASVGRGRARCCTARPKVTPPWHRSRHRVPVPPHCRHRPPGRPHCGVPRCAAPRCPHGLGALRGGGGSESARGSAWGAGMGPVRGSGWGCRAQPPPDPPRFAAG